MSVFSRIVLLVSGLGFIGFGTWVLVDPIGAFQNMNLAMPDEASIRIELRSFYGGLEIGLGLFLLGCLGHPSRINTGLWLTAAAFGTIGVVRLAGMLTEGYASPTFWAALGTELGLAIAALIALKFRPER
ncbi:MAG: DUF4345 family protein [Xanthomonadales bacterium]|nr:DUF4345 family protein [Xanthomonadales bacterium]